MSLIKKCCIGNCVLAGLLICPAVCLGQIEAGTMRFSADTVFLTYVKGAMSDFEGDSLNPAYQDDVKFNSFNFGIGQPSAGVGVGVALMENLVLGLRLALGFTNQSLEFDAGTEAQSSVLFGLDVLPYVEYVFLTDILRPAVIATTGLTGRTGDEENVSVSEWHFFIGGGGGIHLFFVDNFSIDALMIMSFSGGKGKEETDSVSWEYKRRSFGLNTFIGLSGWL
ncbi:MAG: hypothetical protein QNJ97_14770 [Myxococcota bacterium]|nr:hypothetical protein [Myxococcota bacterium]